MFETVISEDGVYRYSLTRPLDGLGEKACLFIMLNPSTADATLDDPTIRRCMGFASGWGYKDLWVANLFAYRATDPSELNWATQDPIGPRNYAFISEMGRTADLVVCAWGTHGALARAGENAKALLESLDVQLHHLGLTKHGFPKHPLYLKANTQPQEWK